MPILTKREWLLFTISLVFGLGLLFIGSSLRFIDIYFSQRWFLEAFNEESQTGIPLINVSKTRYNALMNPIVLAESPSKTYMHNVFVSLALDDSLEEEVRVEALYNYAAFIASNAIKAGDSEMLLRAIPYYMNVLRLNENHIRAKADLERILSIVGNPNQNLQQSKPVKVKPDKDKPFPPKEQPIQQGSGI